MKKTIAILLLAVYLFNLAGYPLVFHYFIFQSEQILSQQLDQNNYKDAELVEISIPFNLPYRENSSQFERMDGTIEMNGILYNYVKRRIYHDTLYIMCLPNEQKTKLIKGKANFAGEVNDFATTKKDKGSTAKKESLSAEYNSNIAQYKFILPAGTANQQNKYFSCVLPAVAADIPEQPPQFTC